VLPRHGSRPGKGEALWKSLHATSGDLLVFVDSDLIAFDPRFVVGLLGPLLTDPTVGYVKALYDRPLTTTDGIVPSGGGRVTELVARPLLNAFWPELAGFVQPLSGEYAGRRELLEQVPFVSGYGVELGLLVDLVAWPASTPWPRSTSAPGSTPTRPTPRSAAWRADPADRTGPPARRRPPERELLQFLRTADGLEGVSWDVGWSSGRRCGRSAPRATAGDGA
jgi:glucosyl-3-phosphoglycerate synthase